MRCFNRGLGWSDRFPPWFKQILTFFLVVMIPFTFLWFNSVNVISFAGLAPLSLGHSEFFMRRWFVEFRLPFFYFKNTLILFGLPFSLSVYVCVCSRIFIFSHVMPFFIYLFVSKRMYLESSSFNSKHASYFYCSLGETLLIFYLFTCNLHLFGSIQYLRFSFDWIHRSKLNFMTWVHWQP